MFFFGIKGVGGLCPEGMYCRRGTIDPIGCPAGTFSNVKGLKNSSQCQLCPYGKYCGEKNLTAPSGILLYFYFTLFYFFFLLCLNQFLLPLFYLLL